MKLIKCYIENFGKLSCYEHDFSDGLNIIEAENGSGKTTLAAFIKTMLYGFPKTKARSLDENERKKYLPWQGGACGGYLDFALEGKSSEGTDSKAAEKKYRIERTFGQKESADTFRLSDPDTGAVLSDFSENIGFELFGIDADAFSKSTYIPQIKRKGISQNDSISAKLAGLVEESDDIGQYDDAIEKLDKKRLFYSAPTKGQLGLIGAKLETARLELEESKRAESELESDLLPKIKEKEAEIKENTGRLEALKKALDEKNEECIKEKTALIARKAECQNVIGYSIKKKNRLKEQREEYEALLSHFSGKMPEKEKLEKAANINAELERLDTERNEAASKSEELKEFERLDARFKNAPISADELDLMLEGCKKRRGNPKIGAAFAVFGVIAAVLSFAFSMPLPIRILPISAAAILIILSVLFFVGAFDRTEKEIAKRLKDYFPDSDNLSGTEGQGASADSTPADGASAGGSSGDSLATGSSGTPNDNLKKILALRDELSRKAKLKEQIISDNLKKTELDKSYLSKKDELEEVIRSLGVAGNGETSKGTSEYKELLGSANEKASRLFMLSEQLGLSEAELEEYISENRGIISEYKDGELERREKELAENEKELAGLKQTVNRLEGELNTASLRLQRAKSEADRLSEIAERLPDRTTALYTLEDKKKLYEDELFLVTRTIALLKTAKTDLSTRYLKDMRESFNRMMLLVTGEDGFTFDQSFSVTASRNGAGRSEEYFSSGYRDLIDILVSLSLTDALFKEEKPCLILDDPFVNLDKEKLKKALMLIDELAKDRQVIYFICHESRRAANNVKAAGKA